MAAVAPTDDFNRPVIEEFRANNGAVDTAMGGVFAGQPILILHTTGAKTGKPRLNPLVYATDGERLIVSASKGGAPSHPDWLFNVRANPDVRVELSDETFRARAAIIENGPHRDELYARLAAIMEQFAHYETKTDRRIPVIVLERAD